MRRSRATTITRPSKRTGQITKISPNIVPLTCRIITLCEYMCVFVCFSVCIAASRENKSQTHTRASGYSIQALWNCRGCCVVDKPRTAPHHHHMWKWTTSRRIYALNVVYCGRHKLWHVHDDDDVYYIAAVSLSARGGDNIRTTSLAVNVY